MSMDEQHHLLDKFDLNQFEKFVIMIKIVTYHGFKIEVALYYDRFCI